MKIRKLFQRAAAFALAAVTALSAVPATTAFAAGDIGTISFTHTYRVNQPHHGKERRRVCIFPQLQ